MKLLFTFAIIVIALTVVFGAPDAWNEYKTKHGKKYGATEDAQRKKNFLATDAIITKHNSQTKATYQLGHNQFSDMTPVEVPQYLGAVKPASQSRSLESMVPFDVNTRQLPTSLDYRTHACLAPVKNQGKCAGSYWAFAAITSLEFAHCKKYGSLVTLSEQQLVDCLYDNGCTGGYHMDAWKYLKIAGGSAKQSLYPYTATKNTCKFTSSMIGARIMQEGIVPARNATHMQSALQTIGPLAVAITVVNSFYSYKSGIYNDVACDSKSLSVNHAVVIVGWGTDYWNDIDYWIVRNSWGTGWGRLGYVAIQRGVNKCKIEENPAVIVSVF